LLQIRGAAARSIAFFCAAITKTARGPAV